MVIVMKKEPNSTGKKGKSNRKPATGTSIAKPSYLNNLNPAVKDHLSAASGIGEFLADTTELTTDQRKIIVEQAMILIEQNYAHLPLKRAMHSIDPVQRLKLLLQSLTFAPLNAPLSDVEFHREVTEIF